MPTDRDYAIATMLGENRGDTNQGLAAILDLIMNRKTNPGEYQAKSSSIRDIVTAGNGNQFNNWKPGEPNRDISDRALQGIGSMSAGEAKVYAQAAQVYDDYMEGKNGYQGIAQGATFYQTPKSAENVNSYQNKFYGDDGSNRITVGRHQFTGQPKLFYKDQAAFFQAYPQYNSMASAGYDPSSPLNPGGTRIGPGDALGTGDGSIVGSSGILETGNPFGFGGSVSGGVADGSLGAGIGSQNGGLAFNEPGSGPGDAFGGGNGSLGIGGVGFNDPTKGPGDALGIGRFAGFDKNQYLAANRDVAASGMDAVDHYLRYGAKENRDLTLDGVKFDKQGYLAANQDVARSGMNPIAHYLQYGAKEGRLAQTIGPGGVVSPIDDFLSAGTQLPSNYAQLVEASFGPTVGAGATVGTQGPSTTASPQGPGMVGTQGPGVVGTQGPAGAVQAFDGEQYKAANKDVAASGMNPAEHYLRFGAKEDRALTLDGVKFDGQAYLAKNQDVARLGMNPIQHYLEFGAKEGRMAELAGPGGTVKTEAPLFGATQLPSNYAEMVKASFAPTQGPQMVGTQGPSMVATQGPGATTPTQAPAMAGTAGVPSWFNSADYFNANGDVKASGQDAFTHFKNFGAAEGRALNLDGVHFGSQAYLASRPDVASAGMSPIQHYLDFGMKEGAASPLVNNGSSAPDVGAFGFTGMKAGVFGSPSGGGAPAGGGGVAAKGGGGESGSFYPDSRLAGGGATFDPQKSENAYLDHQINTINSAALTSDAVNAALRQRGQAQIFNGLMPSSTGNPVITQQVSDYNDNRTTAAQQALAEGAGMRQDAYSAFDQRVPVAAPPKGYGGGPVGGGFIPPPPPMLLGLR